MSGLIPALARVDGRPMNISAANSAMYGLAAAQGMFGGAAQAAAGVTSPAAGAGATARRPRQCRSPCSTKPWTWNAVS